MADGAKRARPEGVEDVAEAASVKETPKLILYSYWRSGCSWRVRMVLELLGLPYEYRAVHLLRDGGEQLKDEYVSRNPMRLLPTLLDGDLVLTQSMAICNYLVEVYGPAAGVSLLPSDPVGRARVRAMTDIVVSDTQPVQNLRVLKHVMSFVDTEEEKQKRKMEWGKHYVTSGFRGLEPMLAKYAGQYCYGDQLTFADIALIPQVYNANRFGVDMSEFPTIQRVHSNLSELDIVKRAHPSAVPDADS